MGEVIKTVNLTKDYGSLRAVANLNLRVNKGEILGFLGLNGAGKTTTIRMLLGMVTPTAGSCYLQGERVAISNTEIWRDVGYLVETANFYPDLTVRENLEIVRDLREVGDRNCVEWIMTKLKLSPYSEVKAQNLSLGNGQRLGIAKAIIHKPRILLLDEPTNGLDPAGIVEIRKLLLDLAQNLGVTMIISSHKLGEIAKLATTIAIIHHGELIKNIEAVELEGELQKSLLVAGRDQESMFSLLTKAGFMVQEKPKHLELMDREAIENPDRIATFLVNSGHPPTLLQVKGEDLESYFMRIIGEKGGRG